MAKNGDISRARTMASQTLDDLAQANDLYWLYALGDTSLSLGFIDLAEKVCKIMNAEAESEDWRQFFLMSRCLFARGLNDEALEYAERARRQAPKNAEPYTLIGIILGKRGDLDQAIAMFEESVRLFSEDFRAMYNLALCYEKKGDIAKARAWVDRSLQVNERYKRARKLANVLAKGPGDKVA